ncbi:hypothetical protein F4811DRAFT_569230 [Daldinia bambusicola]|nr:hypothetical protein F4811DRAFT_569230 [Daldinia bambusicola]
MAQTPPPLLDLPADVFHDNIIGIFRPVAVPPYRTFRDYLEASESVRDLINFGLTCKALYGLVAPLIARSKGHPYDNGFLSYAYNIINSPAVAARETIFRLRLSDNNGQVQDNYIETFENRALDLGIRLPPWFRVEFEWTEDPISQYPSVQHTSRGHLAFILLMTMPNLTSFTSYAVCAPVLPRFRPLPLFPSIRHFKLLGYDNFVISTDIANFKYHIRSARNLSVLETVNMRYCSVPIYLPKVDTIRMLSCGFMGRAIHNLLKNCSRHLRTVIYRSGHYDIYLQRAKPHENDEIRRYGDISPQNIIDALVKSRMSAYVETLEIDMREWFVNDPDAEYVRNMHAHRSYKFIGYMSYFTSLRNLTLTQQTVWENWYDNYPALKRCKCFNDPARLVELLPSSLETFALYDVTASFLHCIVELAENAGPRGNFPCLEKVVLRPSPGLARQFVHARWHQDDAGRPRVNGDLELCDLDRSLLSRRGQLCEAFKSRGVDVDFEPEAHPLDTEDKDALRRQQELQHWCEECHHDFSVCVKRTKWHCVYPE